MIVGKFELPVQGVCDVQADKYWRILNASLDGKGELCVYAKFNPIAEKFTHRFRVVFTGETLTSDYPGSYISTVRNKNGLVSHVFYEGVVDG